MNREYLLGAPNSQQTVVVVDNLSQPPYPQPYPQAYAPQQPGYPPAPAQQYQAIPPPTLNK